MAFRALAGKPAKHKMTTVIEPFDMTPPPIARVPDGVHRPLWSVMIPTFNCAKYLRQTLESVLAQDPGPETMQIEVIDDCSTLDDPEAVVRELGRGRVVFYRKPKNEGAIANFNTCIERSRGKLVHILHGDDWVAQGFYKSAGDCLIRNKCGICFVRAFLTNEVGSIDYLNAKIDDFEEPTRDPLPLLYMNKVFTPGVIVNRDVYESTGGFLPSLIHTADWEMWVRAVTNSGGVFLNQPLAYYRFFAGNDTGRLAKSAANIDDMLRCGSVFEKSISNFNGLLFRKNVSSFAYQQALKFRNQGDSVSYNISIKKYKSLNVNRSIFHRFMSWVFLLPKYLRGDI